MGDVEIISYAQGREDAYQRTKQQADHFKAKGHVGRIPDVEKMLITLWTFTVNHRDIRLFREIELLTEHLGVLREKARNV